MNLKSHILHKVVLVLAVLILLYFVLKKESGHDRIVNTLKAESDRAKDSVRYFHNKSNYWKGKYIEAFIEYGKAKREGLVWEQRAAYLREENEILKRRKPVRYTNEQLDSLLVARYPR